MYYEASLTYQDLFSSSGFTNRKISNPTKNSLEDAYQLDGDSQYGYKHVHIKVKLLAPQDQ